eukprot:880742-Pyramimonas_sp.AAC.3
MFFLRTEGVAPPLRTLGGNHPAPDIFSLAACEHHHAEAHTRFLSSLVHPQREEAACALYESVMIVSHPQRPRSSWCDDSATVSSQLLGGVVRSGDNAQEPQHRLQTASREVVQYVE